MLRTFKAIIDGKTLPVKGEARPAAGQTDAVALRRVYQLVKVVSLRAIVPPLLGVKVP